MFAKYSGMMQKAQDYEGRCQRLEQACQREYDAEQAQKHRYDAVEAQMVVEAMSWANTSRNADNQISYLRQQFGMELQIERTTGRQQLREEAEKARTEALARQHEADRQREDYEKRLAALEKRNAEEQKLNEWRSKIQVGETVWATKFGKAGKVVRRPLVL